MERREVFSLQFTVYGLRFTVYGLRFTVYGLRFTVYSLQFTDFPRDSCESRGFFVTLQPIFLVCSLQLYFIE